MKNFNRVFVASLFFTGLTLSVDAGLGDSIRKVARSARSVMENQIHAIEQWNVKRQQKAAYRKVMKEVRAVAQERDELLAREKYNRNIDVKWTEWSKKLDQCTKNLSLVMSPFIGDICINDMRSIPGKALGEPCPIGFFCFVDRDSQQLGINAQGEFVVAQKDVYPLTFQCCLNDWCVFYEKNGNLYTEEDYIKRIIISARMSLLRPSHSICFLQPYNLC